MRVVCWWQTDPTSAPTQGPTVSLQNTITTWSVTARHKLTLCWLSGCADDADGQPDGRPDLKSHPLAHLHPDGHAHGTIKCGGRGRI